MVLREAIRSFPLLVSDVSAFNDIIPAPLENYCNFIRSSSTCNVRELGVMTLSLAHTSIQLSFITDGGFQIGGLTGSDFRAKWPRHLNMNYLSIRWVIFISATTDEIGFLDETGFSESFILYLS